MENNILGTIIQAQDKHHWNDGTFAAKLNISQSTLSRIKDGSRPINLIFLKACAKALPEIKWDIAAWVVS